MSSDLVEIHYIDGPLTCSMKTMDKDSLHRYGGIIRVTLPIKSTVVKLADSNIRGTAQCHMYEYRCIPLPPSKYSGMPERYAAILV